MTIKLPTGHHLEVISLIGGFKGSSGSTLVKMPHYWKSYVTAHFTKMHHPITFARKLSPDNGGQPFLTYQCISMHTGSSDPYVSSLSEKSVPHHYPCEISVTFTR